MKHFAYLKFTIGFVEFTFKDEKLIEVKLVKDNQLINKSEGKYEKLAKDILVMSVEEKKKYLDLSSLTLFQKNVLFTLMDVPTGTTVTYKELARKAGYPKAIRAVAHSVAINPIPIIIPCHRVVRTDSIGQFAWGSDVKKMLLCSEGVV